MTSLEVRQWLLEAVDESDHVKMVPKREEKGEEREGKKEWEREEEGE